MSPSRSALLAVYTLIAAASLVATWSQNVHYFNDPSPAGFLAGFGAFVADLRVNPAARSITLDITGFMLAAVVWMVLEARRVGVRHVWLYIGLAYVTAISFTFPLFLIARELRLADREGGISLGAGDLAGTCVIFALGLGTAAFLLG